MSKQLQVALPDDEMAEIERLANRENISVGEWVRRALREARQPKAASDPESKLIAIRRAAAYRFPTAEIDQMLQEIEKGY